MSNIFEMHFPGELAGVDIDGVDVHMLSLDAMRLLEYFAREADFTFEQYQVLLEIETDLPKVIRAVEAKHRKYFEAIQRSIQEVYRSYDKFHKEQP